MAHPSAPRWVMQGLSPGKMSKRVLAIILFCSELMAPATAHRLELRRNPALLTKPCAPLSTSPHAPLPLFQRGSLPRACVGGDARVAREASAASEQKTPPSLRPVPAI